MEQEQAELTPRARTKSEAPETVSRKASQLEIDKDAAADGPLPGPSPFSIGGGPLRVSDMLGLQRTLGNRFVQRLVARAAQAPEQTMIGAEGGPLTQELATRIQELEGGGAPLQPTLRQRAETRFGTDFSGVRVHTGDEASALNAEVGARAFTTGNDIFLGRETSPNDERTLAHELTHVLQQQSMPPGRPRVTSASDVFEQQADQVARDVASGVDSGAFGRPTPAVAPSEPVPMAVSRQAWQADPAPAARSPGEDSPHELRTSGDHPLAGQPAVLAVQRAADDGPTASLAQPRSTGGPERLRNQTFEDLRAHMNEYLRRQQALAQLLVDVKRGALDVFKAVTDESYNREAESSSLNLLSFALSLVPGAAALDGALRLLRGGLALAEFTERTSTLIERVKTIHEAAKGGVELAKGAGEVNKPDEERAAAESLYGNSLG
jgi:hypothetical protein